MEKINVVMSGLPGNMASEAARAVAESSDLELSVVGLGLENGFVKYPILGDNQMPDIKLIGVDRHEALLEANKDRRMIIVDFTSPDSVNRNAEMYCRFGVPFVMGTTGGERKKLEETVRSSGIPAVIAPNMCSQIVAVQGTVNYIAHKNPGALSGYTLKVIESHQQGKKDTSGTAKALVEYFNQLGIDFDVSQIKMVRDPQQQLKMGVPEQYLKGHGWHRYLLTSLAGPGNNANAVKLLNEAASYFNSNFESAFGRLNHSKDIVLTNGTGYITDTFCSPDKTILIMVGANAEGSILLEHNINGRRPYALGTLDAIRYLHVKAEKVEKGLFSMVDVVQRR